MKNDKKKDSYQIKIEGIVQGVGFRPFIYKLALESGLKGSVANTTEGVLIKTGRISPSELKSFIYSIKKEKPPASVIEKIEVEKTADGDFKEFSIEKSRSSEKKFQLVSPDLATCENCRQDIHNSDDKRRYLYPFTNCTNCGPRFTIIKEMPYDRPRTTMDIFEMCPDCRKEYSDPFDRRFHAQPNACRSCGPRLLLTDNKGRAISSDDPIKKAAGLILKGKLLGIKSLGGFQIACDALSDSSVSELRNRKSRPSKPFAVMTPDIEWIRLHYFLSNEELSSLESPKAPIVLLKKKNSSYPLSSLISLYNKYDGIMLPYTPIHHILFKYIEIPLVMTSGNISEEPIASNNEEATNRLKNICDYYLLHNRDIYSRYDDPVIRIFKGKEMVLRRARGYSPYPVKLGAGIGDKKILAVGAHEKNTFTILTRNYAITSQHIGDLDTEQSADFFDSSLENYIKLFGIKGFDLIAHDMHPDYRSTRKASQIARNEKKLYPVQHHKAHIAGVLAENRLDSSIIGFSWDGTGYGDDKKIWGSEIFHVNNCLEFNRIGHLTEKHLPGGDVTIKRPYRMSAAYLYELFKQKIKSPGEASEYIKDKITHKDIDELEIDVLCKQMDTGLNSPVTTSMGRFFDAVSSLLGLIHISTYEGEAAIALEMVMNEKYIKNIKKDDIRMISAGDRYDIQLKEADSLILIDDIYIFKQILDDMENNLGNGLISFKFHNTLSQMILNICLMSGNKEINEVALSGGVFQNNYLLDLCYNLLVNNGFKVYTNMEVPVNDGGISLGQSYMAAVRNGLIVKE